tara:strand:+ start:469 stop:960 length:492 start_codon:yes stop_codon:yes gene_type:complete
MFRLVEKVFTGLFLIAGLITIQSCSNTLIGEKLENSFDLEENSIVLDDTSKAKDLNKLKKLKKVKLNNTYNFKENKNIKGDIKKENSTAIKDRFSQNSNKSTKKVIFTPQPYRIILKLSGTNPSAPAETVTKALRKAGIQFEVEKIERFEEKNFSKDSSFKRK